MGVLRTTGENPQMCVSWHEAGIHLPGPSADEGPDGALKPASHLTRAQVPVCTPARSNPAPGQTAPSPHLITTQQAPHFNASFD